MDAVSGPAPRPAHLGSAYAAVFRDPSVVASYASRPAYPAALFDLLVGLADPACPFVLDAGTGTGDLARPLARRFARVDAIDPSAAMIEAGRHGEGGDAPNLRWITAAAESAPLDPPYGLMVAGQSLAWMEWSIVLPRWRSALSTRAFVAIVERTWDSAPWRPALTPVIARYSTNREYRPYDLLNELSTRNLYRVVGRQVLPGGVTADVERVIDALHSQNGLARCALGEARSRAFDDEVRGLLAPFVEDERIVIPAGAEVTWGNPV
jgi:SAM-dependent methyltransferase